MEIDATIQDLFIYYFKISGERGDRRGPLCQHMQICEILIIR